MKTLKRWALAITMYALLYVGADRGLWPMIAHFRHSDWQAPNWVDAGISSFLIPLGVACLLVAAMRRELQESFPWPLMVAPLLVMSLTKYAGDAFYPPYSTELLALAAAGAAQAASVWAGWFLSRRLSGPENMPTVKSGDRRD
jgi:hypothetical protein